MKNYILLIGAYERDNFGDLLFAKIFDRVLNPYPLVYGSLMGRDLTSIGGDCVVSVEDFLKDKKQNPPLAVIHCGGETITTARQDAVSMDLPSYIPEPTSEFYRYAQAEISEYLIPSKNLFAYLYNHADLGQKNNFPIAFTSLGGSSLNEFAGNKKFLSAVALRLQTAKFLSVRDRKTKEYLNRFLGIEAKLFPDVVSILSRTHMDNVNQATKTASVKRILSNGPYILFQANSKIMNNMEIEVLSRELGKIIKENNTALVFQPAGLSAGHDSFEEIKRVASILKNNLKAKVLIQDDRNIWTQVAVIANAACCIGSSLHVRVVATAFARPHISLQNQKVTSYAQSWEVDDQPYDVSSGDLSNAVDKALKINPLKLKKVTKILMDKVEEGLDELILKLNLKPNPKIPRKAFDNLIPGDLFKTLSLEVDRVREFLAKDVIERKRLEVEVELIKTSRSWRMTAPLRALFKKNNKK